MKNQSYQPLIRLLRDAHMPMAPLIFAGLLSLLVTLATLWMPLLTRDLISGFQGETLPKGIILLLFVVLSVQALAGGLSHFLLGKVGLQVVASLRNKLLGRLVNLPLSFHDRNRSGELTSRVVSDTEALRSLITEQVVPFVSGLVQVIGSIIVLCILDWHLTLVLFSAVLLAFAVIIPLATKMQGIAVKIQDETAGFTAGLTETLGEIRLVKASRAEAQERKRSAFSIQKLFDWGLKEIKIQALMAPLMGIAMMGALVAILGYGGMRVRSGELEVGELVAFVLYLFNIVLPMVQFTLFFTALQQAIGSAKHIAGLMDEVEEESDQALVSLDTSEVLTFHGVDFAYEPETPILRDVNLGIKPGKVTAFVGPSGGGKSTLFFLLERFYKPTSGRITLGNTDIADLSLGAWRDVMGLVAQDAPLMSGSIRDNITYGLNQSVTDEELHRAAERAYAHGFISQLESGYETEVGERGVKLSGGQRQRIAIARALLRDPQILLLDEATASLDAEAEREVQLALENLMADRTTLVIAHRLSTVVHADHIYVVEDGAITGSGNHRSLMSDHDLYQRLVDHQFKGLQPLNAA